ncbi:hypothetical protein SAMN05421831_101428 [Allopseudospirillum japonicum]|uniref:Uncharacterized protein n=1 Tax=Allopseudospirillum japonicum TaxID=64971 RepID=A0A1H6QLX5_9GAMM|nr:hypothetical protein [Allopseudospirillum japonicum]SEI42024.1 hypothetical protein SAMN05421831_101428 [Allopseudospirillum japonicum]
MLRLGLAVLILPLLGLMLVFWQEFQQVDTCLQAGGAYDYREHLCLYEAGAQSEFIPFSARYPWLVNTSLLASLLGLLMCVFALYRPTKPSS